MAVATSAGVRFNRQADAPDPRNGRSPGPYRIQYDPSAHASKADEPARPPLDAVVLEEVLKAILAMPGNAASLEEMAALAVERYQQVMERDSPG